MESNMQQQSEVHWFCGIVLFKRLHKYAKSLGLSDEQISHLGTLQTMKKTEFLWWNYLKVFFGIQVVVIAVLVSCWSVQWPMSRKDVLSAWFTLHDMDIERELCILAHTELTVDYTRPPVDCNICRNVTNINRIKDITPEEFQEKYAYSGRPVVIMDAAKNWTAIQTFSWSFLRDVYRNDSPALDNVLDSCQFSAFETEFQTLREAFSMSERRAEMKDSQPWYIGWSNCDSSAANILRQHYTRPYFLPRASESSKTDWIFIGTPGYGAHLHIDHIRRPSWQAQIAGTKKWTLEPPPECYSDCVQQLDVTLNPGEIIVVDTNIWYHTTRNVGDGLSICIGSEYD